MQIPRINSQNNNQYPNFGAFKVRRSIDAQNIIHKVLPYKSASIRQTADTVSKTGVINVSTSAAEELKAIERLEANGHLCFHLRTKEKLSPLEFNEFVKADFPNIGNI